MTESWILGAARTPIGNFLGRLASMPAPRLGAVAIQAAIEQAGVDAGQVREVIMGNVLSAGIGQAPARQAALLAGCPPTAAALTINKVCGSGLKAVMLADQAIRLGESDLVVAGGMESMSRAPHALLDSRRGSRFGDIPLYDTLLRDGLWCATEDLVMGDLAEATAAECHIPRSEQDQFASTSHARAVDAQASGAFQNEIKPIAIESRRSQSIVDADEGPRADVNAESLAGLRSAFKQGGSITAGNASKISDGAAAVVVGSRALADQSESPLKARIVATAVSGGPPKDLFLAPIRAIEQVLERAGLVEDDIDLLEINEAFAVQAIACLQPFNFPAEKVNVHGGAIALGHPIGASGARVLVTLLHALARRGQRLGLATLCLGGGNAVAMIVERDAEQDAR